MCSTSPRGVVIKIVIPNLARTMRLRNNLYQVQSPNNGKPNDSIQMLKKIEGPKQHSQVRL